MPSNDSVPSMDWVPEAMVVFGRDGTILAVNRAFEALLGYRREELRGSPLDVLLPDGLPSAPASAPASASAREELGAPEPFHTFSSTVVLRYRDGLRVPMLMRWLTMPADDPQREPRIVASLREAGAAEGSAGDEITALREHRDFFSLFNHDVRQSLQSIQFLCDSISDRAPETASTISEIVGSVKMLLDTIVRLGDSGPVVTAERPCMLSDLLHALGRELRPLAERKGLELAIEDFQAEVRTDPVLLRELLQNIMANAVRYTNRGHVRVQCVPGPSSVRINVVDTGVGIDRGRLERLVEGSEHIAGASQTRGGSGLGLAIARRLADVLGCTIEARSKPGEGSCFTVVVPRAGARRDPLAVGGGPGDRAGEHRHY